MSRFEEQRQWGNLTRNLKRGVLALKENAVVQDGRVYDQNGVDKSHLAELSVKTTPAQREALQAVDELSTHELENGHFVFAFFESCKTMAERYPAFTQPDLARLMFIGTYTGYQTGRLQHDNGKVIDKRALETLIGISRNRFAEFYRKLIDADIVQEQGGEIHINPSVFFRGPLKESGYKLSEYSHTRMFRKTVRDLYAIYKGRKTAQLAIIYAVLPFLNFRTNVVCFNPQDSDDDLRAMNLDHLAALLGYKDTDKLRRALEGIVIDGEPVFWLPHNAKDRRQKRIVVNPRVVFAGPAESLGAVKVLFS
ncbi:hypothetical protein [Peribacillus huizhouensis]|uniref:Replication protein n=1 Tax=Peribacillus huizhouensis TaxID=1501239 RepID=A0ABR6CR82_9BACI|nr:hypothetical protein [Peribacillus huizhouensis]MBA9027535.1 hypothetical protein [Peribacillus huizhouensis]